MMRRLPVLLVAAALSAVAGCASAGPLDDLRIGGGAPDTSAYGLFLAGRAALEAGDTALAEAYFTRAQAAAPKEPVIAERAFQAALLAGDLRRAGELARRVDSSAPSASTAASLATLAEGVDLLAQGRAKPAAAKLDSIAATPGVGAAAALVRPWAKAMARDWEGALTGADTRDKLFNLVTALGQAQLYEHARRHEEAETAYKAALVQRAARPLVAPHYGAFLERRGRRAEALALYDELIAAGQDDQETRAARARVAANAAPPPLPTLRQGAAGALMAPAAAMLSERQFDSALLYLRLVLRLDPDREEALLMMGDVRNQAGDVEVARELYARIPQGSSRYLAAQARLAYSHAEKDPGRAIRIAEAAVARNPDDLDAQMLLAEMLRADKRYADAAAAMDKVIDRSGAKADWKLYYMRGAVLERAGRWPQAEADLKRALELRPDQPELLNYLGYAWIERRHQVPQALKMIEKAIAADPDNGAYIDSLGWAYFQLGDYKTALQHIERAVQLMPGDPEVNDHLGDVYWRLGRRDEARYKWRAALTLEPPPEVKSRAEAKLASQSGLDAVATAAATAAPAQ
jgi:tetratricopeptide (TPR) repeat protein